MNTLYHITHKNIHFREKFVNDCRYCWGIDVSGQYGKATKPKGK